MAMLPRFPAPRREAGRHRRTPPRRHPALLGLVAVLVLLVTGGTALVNLTASPTAAPVATPSPTTTVDDPDPRSGAREPTASPPGSPSPSTSPSASPPPSPSPGPERADRPASAEAPGSADEPDLDRDADRESRRRSPDSPTDDLAALEDEVTALTNDERRAAGCGTVDTDERLRAAARGHSRDMADNDYFSHTAPDGSDFGDRARAQGYPSPAGENIAYGYRTPAEVMDGWMNSDGHRRNILNCSHEAIGVGLAYDGDGRPYWTQVFGR